MGPERGPAGAQRGQMGHMGLIFPFFFHLFPRCRLVHLAIIHCAPDVALFCIAHLPTEMLETQNDLFQVCGCDGQKRRAGATPSRHPIHLPFPQGLPTHTPQSTAKVPCEQSLFGEEKTQGEGISISQHRG